MFVGPGWLNQKGRWECPYELLKQSYEDGMRYYGNLKKEGKLLDLTMSEFADYYREKHPDYLDSENALWKDILYGSQKQYFWYVDPFFRVCLDFNQGGAMIDMRPYVARVPQEIGIGTEHVYDASYPYLIQANYRAGYFTHYAGAGTVCSCKVSYHGQETDLCLCRTLAKFEKVDGDVVITANPVTVTLDGLDIIIQSVFTFKKGKGEILFERKILNDLRGEKVTFKEYFTGGFGLNEYQQDLGKVSLSVDDEKINYQYLGRKINKRGKKASVVIPDINTVIQYSGDVDALEVEEGIAFSPCYKLAAIKTIDQGGTKTCLNLAKVN